MTTSIPKTCEGLPRCFPQAHAEGQGIGAKVILGSTGGRPWASCALRHVGYHVGFDGERSEQGLNRVSNGWGQCQLPRFFPTKQWDHHQEPQIAMVVSWCGSSIIIKSGWNGELTMAISWPREIVRRSVSLPWLFAIESLDFLCASYRWEKSNVIGISQVLCVCTYAQIISWVCIM